MFAEKEYLELHSQHGRLGDLWNLRPGANTFLRHWEWKRAKTMDRELVLLAERMAVNRLT